GRRKGTNAAPGTTASHRHLGAVAGRSATALVLARRGGFRPQVELGAGGLDLPVAGEWAEGHQHQHDDLLHGVDPLLRSRVMRSKDDAPARRNSTERKASVENFMGLSPCRLATPRPTAP